MHTDLTYALRMFRKTPWLTAVALLCLAAAIGIATAGFSVVHDVFFSPLPVPGGDRLVTVRELLRSGQYDIPLTAAQLTRRRERSTSFEALGAWYTRQVTVAAAQGDGVGRLVRASYVSRDALALLGTPPLVGRHFTETDLASPQHPVVMLGHDVWRSRFGADQQILDRTVQIAGAPHRVIGVMPQGFRFPVREDLWIPVQTDVRAANVTQESLTAFGKLKRGVTMPAAAAELATLAAGDAPRDAAQATVPLVMPFARGFMTPEEVWALYAFLAGLLLFLVVISANLANLFLARNSARTREIALRAALGASRARLMKQLLVESFFLGAGGAIAGLAISRLALSTLRSLVDELPWWADFSVDGTVLAFVVVAGVVASVVAGMGPAVRLTRATVGDPLKGGSATTSGLRFSRTGAVLVVAQVAISVGFLSVVGVLAQSLFGFSYQRFQIPAAEVLVAQVYLGPPPEAELAAPNADRRAVWLRHYDRSLQQFERMRAELQAQPGVRHVTYATLLPGNDVESARIEVESGGSDAAGVSRTRIAEVGPAFFDVLGASVVTGRDFTAGDRAGAAQTVIVNAPFAEKYFPGRSPLGRKLRVLAGDGRPDPWLEIVGVVPDLAMNPGDPARADGIYLPFEPSNFARLAVLTDRAPADLIPRLYEIVTRENARAQVQSAESLDSQMRSAETIFRGLGAGLSSIGATALLLSAVSLYALISFGVTRRTKEIGIRVALGASRSRILRTVLGRELVIVLVGAAAGVGLGIGLYQLVAMMPYDLRPAGPSLLVAFVGLMVLVGACACLVPARRAVSIAPTQALREQ